MYHMCSRLYLMHQSEELTTCYNTFKFKFFRKGYKCMWSKRMLKMNCEMETNCSGVLSTEPLLEETEFT